MRLDEIVLFPAQLSEVETVMVNAERKGSIETNEFDIGVELRGEILDENTGESTIILELENEGFAFKIQKRGIFKFDKQISDEGKVKLFLEVQGVRILWSYLREDVYSITSKMLKQPIMIPTLDVMKTLEKAK